MRRYLLPSVDGAGDARIVRRTRLVDLADLDGSCGGRVARRRSPPSRADFATGIPSTEVTTPPINRPNRPSFLWHDLMLPWCRVPWPVRFLPRNYRRGCHRGELVADGPDAPRGNHRHVGRPLSHTFYHPLKLQEHNGVSHTPKRRSRTSGRVITRQPAAAYSRACSGHGDALRESEPDGDILHPDQAPDGRGFTCPSSTS
jgi:hypothetical protein